MKLASQVKSGLKWSAFTKFSGQFITWGLTIYVMRILVPEDYGLMAIAGIFIAFLLLLKEFGLGPSIVQSHNISEEVLQKIFGVLIIISIVLIAIVIIASPYIAQFFGEQKLEKILQFLSIQFILIPFETIPYALLQKSMRFKRLGIIELVAAIVGGTSTLLFALSGYGVWALVYGAIVLALCRTVLLNFFSRWFAFPVFSGLHKIKQYITYGGLITLDQTLWFFYSQADSFIVGKILGAKTLGYYSVAIHLSSLPMQKLNGIINQVAFPAFAKIQDDKEQIKTAMISSIRLIAFFAFPIFFGIASVAEDAILLILGDKWMLSIVPITVLSMVMPIRFISNLYPTVVRSCGRADISIINLLIASVIMISSFVIGSYWGIIGICYAWLFGYPVVFFIEVTRSRIVTKVSIYNILEIIKYPMIASVLMYFIISIIKMILEDLSHGPSLIIGIIIGMFIYTSFIYIFSKKEMNEVLSLVKR